MNEMSFFVCLMICTILIIAHQGVCIIITGRTGWEMMVETAPGFLSLKAAVSIVVVWSLVTTLVTAAIWTFLVPTWLMVLLMVISEAVGVYQLRKISQQR